MDVGCGGELYRYPGCEQTVGSTADQITSSSIYSASSGVIETDGFVGIIEFTRLVVLL